MQRISAISLIFFMIACGTPSVSNLKLDNTPPPSFSDRTLDRVTFLTAHNAFANNGDDARFIAPNQEWGITKQMEMGVRGFMLDIWSKKGEAVLCHSTCGFAGIFPWILLTDELKRFEDFMKKNPEAIITLHLEWTPNARVNEFEAALDKFPDLKNMIFDPYKWEVRQNGWPKISEMIAQNKRLLILSQTDATRYLGVGYDRDFTVENYWSLGPWGKDRQCKSRWDDIPLDTDNTQANKFRRLFVMNHFRDLPSILTAALDNRHGSLWGRVSNECLAAARRVPNFVALDFVNKGTGPETLIALNKAIGIAFEHNNWQGRPEIMLPGPENVQGGDGKLEDDSLSSVEIFFKGTRVALFADPDQNKFLLDVNETTSGVGTDANDLVSSWRVDN